MTDELSKKTTKIKLKTADIFQPYSGPFQCSSFSKNWNCNQLNFIEEHIHKTSKDLIERLIHNQVFSLMLILTINILFTKYQLYRWRSPSPLSLNTLFLTASATNAVQGLTKLSWIKTIPLDFPKFLTNFTAFHHIINKKEY